MHYNCCFCSLIFQKPVVAMGAKSGENSDGS
jgi:hypothetical protein